MPVGTTHAAAASIGNVAYVIGGRGAATNSPLAQILAIDPSTGRVRSAGRLAVAVLDLAAVSDGSAILVAGGRALSGTRTQVSLLKPAVHRATSTANRTTASVYARTRAGMLTGAARFALPRVYVPNSGSNTVDVIDPKTFRVIDHFAVGALPQHVTPSWNLRMLYVDNDRGNSLTPIDPRTGRPTGRTLSVADPYNLYFTPDGRSAIVVAERLQRLDFRNPTTFRLQQSLAVPCRGVDHMDFTADGRFALASCEFSGQLVRRSPQEARRRDRDAAAWGDAAGRQALTGWTHLLRRRHDGRRAVEISAAHDTILGFVPTGEGARSVSEPQLAPPVRVEPVGEHHQRAELPDASRRPDLAHPHGSPDMGGVSADGRVLWLSGRYSREVYAIDTTTGRLLARIPVGAGPHGLCVWPQPGRYSLGHTGILR